MPRASTGSALHAKSRRSARCLDAILPIRCCATSPKLDEPALQASLDRLADADLLFVEGAPPEANYRFKHALIQDAAYDSLLKSRRQALHRRAAELLRDDKERAAAEPEVIAHHFTQAGLDDQAIEWWGKAGDQALRRSAFQEAIAHLGKAIELADKAAGAERPRAPRETAVSSQRLKLQADFAQAAMWSRGFAAEETKVAFARAAELAAKSDDFSERFAAAHGQWTSAFVRGELNSAHELASAFLREAEDAGRITEVGVGRRSLALICYFLGEFAEAQSHCERALATCNPEHYEETRRYGEYTSTVVTAFLALTNWQLGEVERARELIERANRLATELGHVPSMAAPLVVKSQLEILRGDPAAALNTAEALEALSREHGMRLQHIWAEILAAWARGRLNDPAAGAAQLLKGLAVLAEHGQGLGLPFYSVLLAELEMETLGADRALARIDEALALAHQGEAQHLAFLHRLRGDILLKRDPPDVALAEDAYRSAITIAKQQAARSPGLLAALSLAKLYHSTGRPAEAHAILAPALEGFSPTPEMPEIAEAQAVLAALAETDEVKAAEALRERRLQLQSAYSYAIGWSKGYNAEETKASLARIAELTGRTNDFSARFGAFMGQFAAATTGGELGSARDLALTVLREAQDAGRAREAAAANWWLGLVAYWRGEFVEARTQCERALAAPDLNPDPKAWETSVDRVSTWAPSCLAAIMWQLGEVERARDLINSANRRASEVGDVGPIANALFWKSYLEIWRGDPFATLSAAEALETVAREHGLTQYLNEAELHASWARGRMDDPAAGAAQVRRVLASFVDQGVKVNLGFYTGLLAQLEGEMLVPQPRWPASTKLPALERRSNIIARSPSCIAFAANFCSSATRPIPLRPRKPSVLLSRSRRSNARAARFFWRRSPSPSSINRPPAPPTPTLSSRQRSKALHRRRKCPRSPRRRR